MKNDMLGKFRNKLFWQIIFKVFLSILILLAVVWTADGILNDLLAETVSGFSRSLYLFLMRHKSETFFAIFAIIVVISVYFTLVKTTNYMAMIVDSIDKVFHKEENLVTLPKDFRDIETKLNTIKYETVRSEALAKEAEIRKNDLVVYLAHDLKTPLTSVIGYLTLLKEEPGLTPDLRAKYIGISLEKAKRLESLINEFFDITRFSLTDIRLETGRLNLTRMLQQLVDEFYPMLTAKHLTAVLHAEPEIYVEGDSDKLARAFDNLIRNAISYSFEGTAIEIHAAQTQGGTYLRFVNHGPVIARSKLGSIFDKFYRLDEARSSETGGAGLGLAITKEIITLHHGTISASSTEEATQFAVYLPDSNLRKS